MTGLQLCLFLDIHNQNSEVLSLDWAGDGSRFLSLDMNQHLRIWEMGIEKIQNHLAATFQMNLEV